jgi:hypothetical protein
MKSRTVMKAVVQAILEKALDYEWSVQRLGMLRLYLPGRQNVRLHVWHKDLAVPNVSTIHTHPWRFASHVVAGQVENVRIGEDRTGWNYLKHQIQCGAGGGLAGEAEPVNLYEQRREWLVEGDSYEQDSDEIHNTLPEDGTVTLVERVVPPGKSPDHAYVYYPVGTEWVSAEPGPATKDEILLGTQFALQRWF